MTNTLPVGSMVLVDFEGRGLARVESHEDGLHEVVYQPDPNRTSEYMKAGDTEWLCRDDLLPVGTPQSGMSLRIDA